jgi:hypothetical protein
MAGDALSLLSHYAFLPLMIAIRHPDEKKGVVGGLVGSWLEML